MCQPKSHYHSRDEVGLKLVQVDVEGAIEAQRGSDGGDDLGDEPVEVGEGRRRDSEVAAANVIDPVYQLRHPILTHASLSTMKEQSECSRVVWVVNTEL